MCLSCHQGLSDEEVISQLKDSIKDPQYELWNETSISHMMISGMGTNGMEAQKLAIQLLDGYVNWKKNNKYSSDGTFFGNPNVEYVELVIEEMNKKIAYFKENNFSQQQILEMLNHGENGFEKLENYKKNNSKETTLEDIKEMNNRRNNITSNSSNTMFFVLLTLVLIGIFLFFYYK